MDVETNTSRENTCSFIFFSCFIAYSCLSEIKIFRAKNFRFYLINIQSLINNNESAEKKDICGLLFNLSVNFVRISAV